MPKFISKILDLKPEEKVLKAARQHPIGMFWQVLISIILIALPFFLLFPLFSWGGKGIVVFIILLIIAIFYLVRTFVIWYFNAFFITNFRIIDVDQSGLWQRIVSEYPLEKIKDVSYRFKGIGQTLFQYGNITIAITGTETKIILKNISQPQRIHQLILELQSLKLKEILGETKLSAHELIKLVERIKKGISEEGLEKMVKEEEED